MARGERLNQNVVVLAGIGQLANYRTYRAGRFMLRTCGDGLDRRFT
jgi:hypothetical protein